MSGEQQQTQQTAGVPAAQPGSNIQRLPVPENRGPAQHEQMPLPLGHEQGAIHNYFLRNLQDERSGAYQPGAYSADPAVTPDRGQPLPTQPRSGDIQQPGTGQQSQLPAEQTPYPGQPGADSYQTQQPMQQVQTPGLPQFAEPPPQQQPMQQMQPMEQPTGSYGLAELEVDGQRITADDVRALKQIANDAKHLEADYTRKTQVLSRVRQEHEALGQELTDFQQTLERREEVIKQIINGNVDHLNAMNTQGMTQEQFEIWKQQREGAERGKAALEARFAQLDAEQEAQTDKVFKRKSSSTAQLLRWHEPRWDKDNLFYGKLREFAVNEGLMTPEAFDQENDFMKIVGLISMMDRHTLPETIRETRENPRPPERQHELPTRDAQGRFQSNVAGTTNAVLASQNARADGSAYNMFMAKLEDERRRGVAPQPHRIT